MVCLSATWVQARPPFLPPQTAGTALGQEQVWAGKHRSSRLSNLTSSPPRACSPGLDSAVQKQREWTSFLRWGGKPECNAKNPPGWCKHCASAFLCRKGGRKTPLFPVSANQEALCTCFRLGHFQKGLA